jgi:RecA-family ATPase
MPTAAQTPPPRKDGALSKPFQDMTEKSVKWLLKDRIPFGKVTVLDGDPALGKSTLTTDLAARMSTNGDMPDGPAAAHGPVIIMSAEDDPEDTIRPRLRLAGADLANVHFLDPEEKSLTIPEDLKTIETEINRLGAKLLIIDPLMAYLSGRIDSNSDQSMRQALKKLSAVARRTGCAIVCLRHLNKGNAPNAAYRGGGSIATTAHARSALLAAVDPDDETKRLLAVVKSNRAARAATLRYVLAPVELEIAGEKDVICKIGWCGESPYTADQLVQRRTEEQREQAEERKTERDQAKELLRQALAEGPKPVAECKAHGKTLGISASTMDRAARDLGVILTYFDPDKGDQSGQHTWRLPDG